MITYHVILWTFHKLTAVYFVCYYAANVFLRHNNYIIWVRYFELDYNNFLINLFVIVFLCLLQQKSSKFECFKMCTNKNYLPFHKVRLIFLSYILCYWEVLHNFQFGNGGGAPLQWNRLRSLSHAVKSHSV